MKTPIQTERLSLRPYADSDREEMLSLLREERIKENYMIPDFADDAQADAMFDKLKDWSHSSEHIELGMDLDGRLIGFINDVELSRTRVEVGIVVSPAHWGRGFATEALRAVLDALLAEGVRQVVTCVFVSNPASMRVMEKCGMHRQEGLRTLSYRGKERPYCTYLLQKEEK